MNLSLKEIEILNALKAEYPKPSSVKKLALFTHRERSVIKNVLHGLKALTLLSVTDKNEVYLLKAGKEYLGVDYTDIKPFIKSDSAEVHVLKANPVESSVTTIEKEATAAPKETLPINIEQSLLNLASKLKVRRVSISELSLKVEVLERLSLLLSDDISDVLSAIAKDLTATNAAA